MKLELDIDFCNGFFYTLVEEKIAQQRVLNKRAFFVRMQHEKILAAQSASGLLHYLWGKLWGRRG